MRRGCSQHDLQLLLCLLWLSSCCRLLYCLPQVDSLAVASCSAREARWHRCRPVDCQVQDQVVSCMVVAPPLRKARDIISCCCCCMHLGCMSFSLVFLFVPAAVVLQVHGVLNRSGVHRSCMYAIGTSCLHSFVWVGVECTVGLVPCVRMGRLLQLRNRTRARPPRCLGSCPARDLPHSCQASDAWVPHVPGGSVPDAIPIVPDVPKARCTQWTAHCQHLSSPSTC